MNGTRTMRLPAWRGHLRLMRPFAWLWFDLLPAATLLTLLAPEGVDPAQLVPFLLAIVLADSGISTLNDVCDLETDRLSLEADRHLRPLVSGEVSASAATLQALVLLMLAMVGVTIASPASAVALGLAIGIGVAYSVPPIRLSGRPGWSMLVWPAVGGAAYASAALLAGRWITVEAVVYLLGVGAFYAVGETLAKDIRDWDNDRAAGKRTTVVSLGPERAAMLSQLGAAVGSGILLAFLWWRPLMTPAGRWLGTLLLLAFMVIALRATRILGQRYHKPTAIRLHLAYVYTYMAFNIIMLVDRGFHFGGWQ